MGWGCVSSRLDLYATGHKPDPMFASSSHSEQQVDILREDFGNLAGGTCEESLNGGNHIRLWRQNGTTADSGAWFLAASKEENATLHHMIIPDGCALLLPHYCPKRSALG